MSLLTLLPPVLASSVFYLLAFVVAVSVIVFVHEYGHFIVARWCGVKVEAFSIGFGKEIIGRYDKHGTRWKLCRIPLGGYVKFLGDSNAASMPEQNTPEEVLRDPGCFHTKPVWQRAAVVAAGPAANFILAIGIFAAAFSTVGVPVTEPRVYEVLKDSAAEQAGIKPGDRIISVNGWKIETFSDLQDTVIPRAEETLSIVIDRQGQILNISATPKLHEDVDNFGNKFRIGLLGVKPNPAGADTYKRLSPVAAVQKGAERSWFIVTTTFKYLTKIVMGRESADMLGGPGSIAKAAGDAASVGFLPFISVIAFISVSIGLINLFPIPMLDGGHLVYYGIEALRGRPLGPNAQEWGFRIGFSMVILLMMVGIWNDFVKFVLSQITG